MDIVSQDSFCLVNTFDDDGFSPLLLIARNNQSGNLIRCMKHLLMALLIKDPKEEVLKVDMYLKFMLKKSYNFLYM